MFPKIKWVGVAILLRVLGISYILLNDNHLTMFFMNLIFTEDMRNFIYSTLWHFAFIK